MNEFIDVKYINPKKGKGAFAKKDIKKGTIIDVAHVIPIPNEDHEKIFQTILYGYTFIWDNPTKTPDCSHAIAMSISQFINHSFDPNLRYYYNLANETIIFKAIKHISLGEELTVNYNGNPGDNSKVWFEVLEE